ncbi:hypothetical protein U14_00551 [Candidatus Moduliflexus flocculans]|uniref:YbbR family protein n=1 Tax=Candidatus Moduliflexus flocculans TaxID=1499966 RepID=A0A0S6VVK7_9BACT|nr:hypothetical protein U14_00551 [Candidatus Moduliflexus flocculans]
MKIFENITLKLVALGLAIIIWFMVVGEQKSEVRVTVPVELRNLPTDLEIVKSISQVEVTLRGFSSFVKRLTPADIEVYVDLSNVVRGINSFVLSADEIRVPVGATVTQVSPSQLDVFLDATTTRSVPVETLTRGKPVDGYVVSDISVKPNAVLVTGAESSLKNLAKIDTEPINLDNLTESISRKVKVKFSDATLRLAKKEEDTVEVAITIEPEMMSKFFENIPVRIEGSNQVLTLFPDSVTALIHGPKLQISAMEPKDIPVVVHAEQLPTGQSSVQPEFRLPETMTVKVYYPKTITVTIASPSE